MAYRKIHEVLTGFKRLHVISYYLHIKRRKVALAKLIAIDGNSLMHRAFYALPPMMSKSGTPTGAVYGFISMLLKLVERKPDYLLVAFDMHGPTFRHEQYDNYKAGRKTTPDDLRPQFPLLQKLLGEMGISVVQVERYEADDLLGTYARIANENGDDALLVTGDRDALQLISEHTHVLMTKRGISDTIEFDEATLFEHYGRTPGEMPHLKGLMGDSSDNIPGILGVGEKTAKTLLDKYGNMENVLANAENEKGALRQKLIDGAESARMSYRLGLIDTHAPVTLSLQDCRFVEGNMAGGVSMMNELEMRSLIERLPKGAGEVRRLKTTSAVEIKHVRIDNADALDALLGKIKNTDVLALDAGEMLSLSVDGVTQYDIALGATLLDAGLDENTVYAALKNLFESKKVSKLVFDAKRIKHALNKFSIAFNGVVFDAMVADYLLSATNHAPSLNVLCEERLHTSGDNAAALHRLYDEMLEEMREKDLFNLYSQVELPLVDVLYDMERVGFMVDRNVLEELNVRFTSRIGEIANEIYACAGEQFNILSPKQLGHVLFETLQLPPQKKTKSGYSTDAEVLEKLEDMHPIVPLVMEYRFLSKLNSTFVDGLMKMINPKTGRVHTSFNQNVTATGRISSTEPNLQNIPVRTELGREIRRAFVAGEGQMLVDADYSQIELRLLAYMSNDERMIESFRSDADIHRRTASEVFNTPYDQVTGEQRGAAKAVNFGIVYGISDFGLARNLNISRKAASNYIEMYLERYPGIKQYMQNSVAEGKRLGYVTTLMGRRRDLPELKAGNFNTRSFGERVAMNMPIQGTAADIIKLAMVRVHAALGERRLEARLVLQIHDELIIETPFAEVDEVSALLKDCMQGVIELSVPLLADVNVGDSWYESK